MRGIERGGSTHFVDARATQLGDDDVAAFSLTMLSTLIFTGVSAVQRFSKEPAYTEVNPGANAVLECLVENIGGECRWQKDGKVKKSPPTSRGKL